MTFENPLVIDLTIGVGALGGLGLGWFLVRSGVKTWAQIYSTLSTGRVERATARKIEAEARKVEAEAEGVETDNASKRELADTTSLVFRLASAELEPQRQLRSSPPRDEIDQARRESLARALIEALEALRRQDVDDLDVRRPPPEAA